MDTLKLLFRIPLWNSRQSARNLLIVLLVLLLVSLGSCETRQESHTDLPWQIKQDEHQRSTVFGVTLGETTLKSIQEQWHARPSIALFANRSDDLSLEAYFERITLGPFQVKVVARLQAEESWLKSIQQKAPRPRPGPSGDYRYVLSEANLQIAESLKISELTYIPGYKVEKEVLRQRFGEPDEIKVENENTTFWFYPNKGLLVTINQPGKDMFHYTNPADFSAAVARLIQSIKPLL